MQPTLEQLLADIYALDPALSKQDEEVRALVQYLLAEKPTVPLSAAFRARLRAELLEKRPVIVPTTVKTVPWWLFYAAPIGVTALLIMMLVPEYTKTQAPFVPTTMPSSEKMAPVADEALFMTAPDETTATKRSTGLSSENEVSNFDVAADMVAADMITIGIQEAGTVVLVESAVLTAPAYVVIQEVGQPEAVFAVSEILPAGEQLPFSITLEKPLRSGGTYEAVLYHDISAGSHVVGNDLAVFSVMFSVAAF